jgi:hypothetical protein
MKPFLRFAKLFAAFLLIMAGAYWGWVANHQAFDRDTPTLICIGVAAIGFAILWQDWRATRS